MDGYRLENIESIHSFTEQVTEMHGKTRSRDLSSSTAANPEYEPAEYDGLLGNEEETDIHTGSDLEDAESDRSLKKKPFLWSHYVVFLCLGVAMLWAWNMFLAAAPYFHRRFEGSQWAIEHYESSTLLVSTTTNLLSVLVLAKLQRKASYPLRISFSLVILMVVFGFLAVSTVLFRAIPVGIYFVFVMTMVLGASLATGMNQNGVFAFVSGFGRPEYTQAIMAGQGVAGVLPCIVQIMSVLGVTPKGDNHNADPHGDDGYYKSGLAYFSVAVLITLIAFLAFMWLMNHNMGPRWVMREIQTCGPISTSDTNGSKDKSVGLWKLFLQLKWLALSLYMCFTVTMVFPVFTAKVNSVHYQQGQESGSRFFRPEVFIPLAFLFWNVGDLLGRLSPVIPPLGRTARYPRALFTFAVARLLFIPLYLACNLHGKATDGSSTGFVIKSDFFYLFIIQFGFGLTNGFLGSVCMMCTNQYVEVEERGPAAGFMSMMLVAGLASGSLLSFFFSSV